MRIEPHARDPDDDPSEHDDADRFSEWDDDALLKEHQTDHVAAFVPPRGDDHVPLPASYLHGQRLRKYACGPQDELRVLDRLRTVTNDKGVEVLAPGFLAEIFAECHTVRDFGLSLAGWATRKARARNDDEQREMANDLFQECVFRWLDGSWNYSVAHFNVDRSRDDPLLSIGARLFGSHGHIQSRLKSVLHGEQKRARTRAQLESQFFESHLADLTPRGLPSRGANHGDDERDTPDVKALDPVTLDDVLRLMQTPQVQQRIQVLVELAAKNGGFGKHASVAPKVFRLLYVQPKIPRDVVAQRCGVPLGFVYKMDQSEYKDGCAPYVVEQIRKHAVDTEAYKELMGLCPQELLERFRHHQMVWLAHYLSEYVSDWDAGSLDTPDDERSGD